MAGLLVEPEFSWLIDLHPLGHHVFHPASHRGSNLGSMLTTSFWPVGAEGDGPVPPGKGFFATKMSCTGAHPFSSSIERGHVCQEVQEPFANTREN